MQKQISQILLLTTICISFLMISPVEAKITDAADTARLEQASQLINSKQYEHGYISFRSMANRGCPYSQCILGIMRQKGLGVKKSAIQAKYWFQKSARQGFADAENRLGQMYYHGDGIKKDITLAKRWLSRAANDGVEEARELLAQIPGETNVSNNMAQVPQQIFDTTTNIKKSWQGYSEVVNQLNQLTAATESH